MAVTIVGQAHEFCGINLREIIRSTFPWSFMTGKYATNLAKKFKFPKVKHG